MTYTAVGLPCVAAPVVPPPPPTVWPVLDLDTTGNTVPATNHTAPAGAIYVATNGLDTNSGLSSGAPKLTVNAAVAAAPNGGTLVFANGVYHDSYTATSGNLRTKYLTWQAAPAAQVWFDGDNTRTRFGIFETSGAIGTHTFRGLGFRNFNTGTSDSSSPNPGAIFTSSGTNNNARHVLEDCAFKGMHGVAVNFFKPRGDLGTRMTRCVVVDCGSTGVVGTHFTESQFNATAPNEPVWPFRNEMLVEDSYFARCNNLNHPSSDFGTYQAGIKFHGYLGCTIRGCIVEDINPTGTWGAGFWFDVGNKECDIIQCVARRCAIGGFFYEVGNTGRIVSCLAVDCGRGQTHGNYRIATPHVAMWHCTSVGGATAFEVYDDPRSLASRGYGGNTLDITLRNNLYAGPTNGAHAQSFLSWSYQPASGTGAPEIVGDFTRPPVFYIAPGQWTRNGFYKGGINNVHRWDSGTGAWQPSPTPVSYPTAAALHSGQTSTGPNPDLDLASDPFTNRLTGDYGVKSVSPAFNAGNPLPADIAALVGQPAGSVHSLGYIDVPI